MSGARMDGSKPTGTGIASDLATEAAAYVPGLGIPVSCAKCAQHAREAKDAWNNGDPLKAGLRGASSAMHACRACGDLVPIAGTALDIGGSFVTGANKLHDFYEKGVGGKRPATLAPPPAMAA